MFHWVVMDHFNKAALYSYFAYSIDTYLPLGKERCLYSRDCPKWLGYIPNDRVVNIDMFLVYLGKFVKLVHQHTQEILVSLKCIFNSRVCHERDAKWCHAFSNHLSPCFQIHCFAHRNHFSQLPQMRRTVLILIVSRFPNGFVASVYRD